jgi:ketosteroid isomerase-like protein
MKFSVGERFTVRMKKGGHLMYRPILLGIVILLFAVSAVLAQVPSAVERELIKLENDWSTAWQKHDTAFLQKLFADEYIGTDSDGATYTKAQDIANAKSEDTQIESFVLSDVKVHVYGDTAVVTAHSTNKATFKGKDISGTYRYTDVFVKRDGRWQVVATQETRVAKK